MSYKLTDKPSSALRKTIKSLCGATAVVAFTTITMGVTIPTVAAKGLIGSDPMQRAIDARERRINAAEENFNETTVPLPTHLNNGDEDLYDNEMSGISYQLNSYTKGLPHNENGIVDPAAYNSLLNALSRLIFASRSLSFTII